MRNLHSIPIPLLGGEASAAAPMEFGPGELERLEDVLVSGPGELAQVPDWRLAATCQNLTPVENHAVCGIFPFATQGGASAASAGVAFSFNATDQKVYLHQLGEDGSILRTFTAYSSFTATEPPQMTGFEYFGKFIFCGYAREAAASRAGLGVFDPTGAGSISNPTIEVVAGGTAAAKLRFRGIGKHRGGTAYGWGYREEADVDRPEFFRYAGYTLADLTATASWQDGGTADTSPGGFIAGTPGLPIVACAESGPYTIIGKERELFALDGDYGSQFYVRQIGKGHGPVSTAGMVAITGAAVWMSREGPAISRNGGIPELLGTDRLTRRFATYYDLKRCSATHFAAQNLVLFLLKRRADLSGTGLTEQWPRQILAWDYARNKFLVWRPPTTCFSIGVIAGPELSLNGPTGAPTIGVTTAIGTTDALAHWTAGDATAQTYLEYRITAGTWTVLGPIAAGLTSYHLTGLTAATGYQVRARHYKNGIYSAYSSTDSFSTTASAVGTPTAFTAAWQSQSHYGGKVYDTYRLSWTPGESAPDAHTELWSSTTATFASASRVYDLPVATVSQDDTQLAATSLYWWVRHRLADGSVGTEVALTGTPLVYALP